MAEHLVAHLKTLFVWLGMDKTQAMVSHQPPLPVCSSTNPRTLPHDNSNIVPGDSSCRELALQTTTKFAHHRLSLVSVIQ